MLSVWKVDRAGECLVVAEIEDVAGNEVKAGDVEDGRGLVELGRLAVRVDEVLAGDVGDLRVGHVGEVLASQVLARGDGHEMQVVRGADHGMWGVHELHDAVVARQQTGEGIRPVGVGPGKAIPDVELAVGVEVEEDVGVRHAPFARVAGAVSVGVVEHGAGDRPRARVRPPRRNAPASRRRSTCRR